MSVCQWIAHAPNIRAKQQMDPRKNANSGNKLSRVAMETFSSNASALGFVNII